MHPEQNLTTNKHTTVEVPRFNGSDALDSTAKKNHFIQNASASISLLDLYFKFYFNNTACFNLVKLKPPMCRLGVNMELAASTLTQTFLLKTSRRI